MSIIYLHGGGDSPLAGEATFGQFLREVSTHDGPLLIIAVDEDAAEANETAEYYRAVFATLNPTTQLLPLVITPDAPLTAGRVAALAPAGVFVCGGVTADYHRALCGETGWVDYARQRGIPYGGTSAGAAIAAGPAILGGWRTAGPDRPRQFLFPGAGEGLDELTVRPGLGLVAFAVDVHAGQMGTLSRLVNAVSCGAAAERWAIDEDTMLVIHTDRVEIAGLGQAYHAVATVDGVLVRVVPASATVSR